MLRCLCSSDENVMDYPSDSMVLHSPLQQGTCSAPAFKPPSRHALEPLPNGDDASWRRHRRHSTAAAADWPHYGNHPATGWHPRTNTAAAHSPIDSRQSPRGLSAAESRFYSPLKNGTPPRQNTTRPSPPRQHTNRPSPPRPQCREEITQASAASRTPTDRNYRQRTDVWKRTARDLPAAPSLSEAANLSDQSDTSPLYQDSSLYMPPTEYPRHSEQGSTPCTPPDTRIAHSARSVGSTNVTSTSDQSLLAFQQRVAALGVRPLDTTPHRHQQQQQQQHHPTLRKRNSTRPVVKPPASPRASTPGAAAISTQSSGASSTVQPSLAAAAQHWWAGTRKAASSGRSATVPAPSLKIRSKPSKINADLEQPSAPYKPGFEAHYGEATTGCPPPPHQPHIPQHFICSITQCTMTDPVIASDGFCYEAAAIAEWMEKGHDSSPLTNMPLPSRHLIRNHGLRSAIEDFVQTGRVD